MISYKPLFNTLESKGISLYDIEVQCGMSSRTIAKFRKGESTTLDTIARICEFLDVPIEKVVEIKR